MRTITASAFVALLLAAGCSLVNSFDDVAPRSDGIYVAADGAVRDATTAGDVVTTDAPVDAPDSAIASGGAIVVGGRVEDDAGAIKYVLAVLDPANGRELGTREDMIVAGVQYDGLRDLWYLFESKGLDFVPGPNDEVVLHVRQLDPKTGVWTELSKRTVPTLQSFDSIGVVRERIAFAAYKGPEAGTALEMVTLDTSNPASIADMNKLPIDITPIGVTSSRSSTGVGGYVNLVRINPTACVGTLCQLELLPLRIPNGGQPSYDSPAQLGATLRFNTPSYASMPTADEDLVIFPRASADASAPTVAQRYEPRTHSPEHDPTQFFVSDSALKRAAISNCANMAFMVATNADLKVHAVPLLDDGGGVPTSISTAHSGQAVYFEPTSKTVLAPFAQGSGYDFSAFRLEGTAAAPQLVKRVAPGWIPPADLRPVLLGIREPLPVVCN